MNLQATTIVETIAAMLLVSVSLGIGMMIYLNVLESEQTVARAKARAIISRLEEETIASQIFITENMEMEGLLVEKNVTTYHHDYPGAVLLVLAAYTPDKTIKLCEAKRIVYPGDIW